VTAGCVGLNGRLQLCKIHERREPMMHIVIRPIIELSPGALLLRVAWA
jgi:hypothetical protein